MARILVVQHDPAFGAGRFGAWLEEAGCALDVRHPHRGEAQPSVRQYDGLLVLGSSFDGDTDGDDDEDQGWVLDTRDLIRQAEDQGVPTLALGTGSSMAVSALGGTLQAREPGPLLGLLPVVWQCDVLLDPLFDRIAADLRAVHWISDRIDELPPGSVVLAAADGVGVQAVRLAPTVWGLQFHPEADLKLVQAWAPPHPPRLTAPTPDTSGVIAEVRAAAAELVDAWRPLAVSFARIVRGRAAANGTI